MAISDDFVQLVVNLAQETNSVTVPVEFIYAAYEKILRGEVEAPKYPNGAPSLRATSELALELYSKANSN